VTTHQHLILGLAVCGAIPLLPLHAFMMSRHTTFFFFFWPSTLLFIKLLKLYGISSQLCCSEKNVKLCLHSIKHNTMKTWGSGTRAPHTCNLCTSKVHGIYTMTSLKFRGFSFIFLHHAVVKHSDNSEFIILKTEAVCSSEVSHFKHYMVQKPKRRLSSDQ